MAPPRRRSGSSDSTDSSSESSVASTYSNHLDSRFLEYDDGGNSAIDIPVDYLGAAKKTTEKKRKDFLELFESYQVADHFENVIRPVVKPPFMAFEDKEITKLLDNIKDGRPDITIYELTGVKKPIVTAAEFAARLAIEQNKPSGGLPPQDIIKTLEQEKFYKALREKVYTKEEFNPIKKLIPEGRLKDKFQRTTEVSCLVDAFQNVSLADFKEIIKALKANEAELKKVSPDLLGYIDSLNITRSFSRINKFPYIWLTREYEKATFNPLEVQAMIKILNSETSTKALASKLNLKRRVTMTELLGSSGLKQFKAALKEELDSPQFMTALWQNSVKKYDFEKPDNTFLYLILSGVSGAGKSTSGKQAVERELKKLGAKPTEKGKGEVYLAWVDGGVARELNHMQKLVKYLCIEHGLEVTDLYSESKALDEGKRRVQRQVTKNPGDIGLVIPETYATTLPGSNEDFNTIKSIKNKLGLEVKVHVAYDFVVGINIGRHPKIVNLMGTRRAFDPAETQAKNFNIFNAAKSGGEFLTNIWNKFIQSIGLAEGKAYGPDGYGFGNRGSAEHFQAFGENEGKVENIDINRNFNCNDVEAYTTDGKLWDFNHSKSSDEAVVASRRLRDDWIAQGKPVTLAQYAKDNWRNYPNIMIEYKPGKLKFSFARELEETIKNTMTKKESRSKTLGQYLGSQAYKTFISPIERALKKFRSQEEEEQAEPLDEDFTDKLDETEQENLEFQLKLLKVLNDLQDKDDLNKPAEIAKALKEVRTLEKEKFAQERLEVLDNFRTHHTLNVLVEARKMLEKRLELLMQLNRIDASVDIVELEDPRKATGAQTIPEEKTLDAILAEVDSIKIKQDYTNLKYPDHIFSRLKILIDKRLENSFKKENLKYLLALDRIVCQIDASNEDSVKQGIGLIGKLQDEKNVDNPFLRTKNRTTEPLIDEILDYYKLRLKTLQIEEDKIQEDKIQEEKIQNEKINIKRQLEVQLLRKDNLKVQPNPKIAVILRHPALLDEEYQNIFKESLSLNVPPVYTNLVDIISDLAAKHERLEYKKYLGIKRGAKLLEFLNTKLQKEVIDSTEDLNTRLSWLFSISIEVYKLKKLPENKGLRTGFEAIEERLKQAFDALNQEQHQFQQSIKRKEETIREHKGLRSYLDQRIEGIYKRVDGVTKKTISQYFNQHTKDFNINLEVLDSMSDSDEIRTCCALIEEKTNDFFGLYLIAQKSRMKELKKVIDYEDATALSYSESTALLKKVISDLSTKTELKLQDVFNALTNLPNDVRLIDLVEQMMTLAEEKGLFESIGPEIYDTFDKMSVDALDPGRSRSESLNSLRTDDGGYSELDEFDNQAQSPSTVSSESSRTSHTPLRSHFNTQGPLVQAPPPSSALRINGRDSRQGAVDESTRVRPSVVSTMFTPPKTHGKPQSALRTRSLSGDTSDEEGSVRSEDNTPIPVLGSTSKPRSCATLNDMLGNIAAKPIVQSVGKEPITLYSASGQAYQYQYVDEVASATLQELPEKTEELDKQKLCLTIISMINNILLHHDIVEITAEDIDVQQYAKDYIAHYNSESKNRVQLVVNDSQIEDYGTQSKAFDAILAAVSKKGKGLIPQCVLDARRAEEDEHEHLSYSNLIFK